MTLVFAAGAVLRIVGLAGRSLWDDEAWTYFISSQGWQHLARHVKIDAHPPLSYLIEMASIYLFGPSEIALRLPSLLAGLGLIGVTMWISHQLWGRRAALLGGALVALSPLLIYHSQEARPYSLLALLVLTGAWLMWQHIEEPSFGKGIAAASLIVGASYVHWFGAFLIPFGVLALCLRRRVRFPSAWAPLYAAVAFSLPLVYLLREQQASYAGTRFEAELPLAKALLRSVLVLGPGDSLEGWPKIAGYSLFAAELGLLAGLLLSDIGVRRKSAFPLLLTAVLLLLLFAVILPRTGVLRDAYMSFVAPSLCMVVAAVATNVRSPLARRALMALAIAAPTLGASDLMFGSRRPNADFRDAAAYVSRHPAQGVLLARSWGDLACYKYYEPTPVPTAVFNLDPSRKLTYEARVVGAPLLPADTLIGNSNRLWLLGKVSGVNGRREFGKRLAAAGYAPVEEKAFYQVTITLWERHAHLPGTAQLTSHGAQAPQD